MGAYVTSIYITLNICGHIRPGVVMSDKFQGLGATGMATDHGIMT